MSHLKCLIMVFALVGCGGASSKAKSYHNDKSRDKISLILMEVFNKFDDPTFDRNRYPERTLIKVSDFLGREDFKFRGDPSDFNDTLGRPYMIRRIGDQWEIIALGYNKINEGGGGDDIVFPFSEDFYD